MQLREDSIFVEQIFNVADVDKDETISFKEFRDVVVIFTKGVYLNGFFIQLVIRKYIVVF